MTVLRKWLGRARDEARSEGLGRRDLVRGAAGLALAVALAGSRKRGRARRGRPAERPLWIGHF